MWKDAWHHYLLGKWKLEAEWVLLYTLKQLTLKRLTIQRVGEAMKQLEFSYGAGGNIKWYNHCEN